MPTPTPSPDTLPFPFDWTTADTRAVIVAIVAALVLVIVGNLITRGLFAFAFSDRPRLKVSIGFHPTPLVDVEWPFVRVWNLGLPWSRRTRAAVDTIAYGTVDDIEVEFNWSSSAKTPPETATIYQDRYRDIPLLIRGRQDDAVGDLEQYSNLLAPQTAYLTERVFLTQGYGAEARWPLPVGDHRASITVQSADGAQWSGDFIVEVAQYPARLAIRPATGRSFWHWRFGRRAAP